MAFRAYVLAGFDRELDRNGVARVIDELRALDSVTFVDPVVGPYELVIGVETEAPLENVVQELKQVKELCRVTSLKVEPISGRSRMRKNLENIPLSPRA